MRAEQVILRDIYKQLLDHGYLVSRQSKQTSQGIMEVGVQLLTKDTLSPVTPIMYGLGYDKGGDVQECVNAEIAAIILCADIVGVEIKSEYIESAPEPIINIATTTPKSEATKLTAYSIEYELGSTVREVENVLIGLGVDMREYKEYNKRLKNQGKRMTKTLMADFFFPLGNPTNLKFIEQKKVGDTKPKAVVENEPVFKAEW